MHKSSEYGCILLEQKYKQTDKQIKNFAIKLVKHLPFSDFEIFNAITELVNENVLSIIGDKLIQRRMVKDNELSLKRSNSGKMGGFAKHFAIAKEVAKEVANTEYEYENKSISNLDTNTNLLNTNLKKEKINKKEKSENFQIPDINDIEYFFRDKTEAANFFNFYESKAWMVGKNKMKNWKAAASGWMARNQKNGSQNKISNFVSEMDRALEIANRMIEDQKILKLN